MHHIYISGCLFLFIDFVLCYFTEFEQQPLCSLSLNIFYIIGEGMMNFLKTAYLYTCFLLFKKGDISRVKKITEEKY